MQASVVFNGLSYSVQLMINGDLVDEAGPFDDELDALLAAERAIQVCEDL